MMQDKTKKKRYSSVFLGTPGGNQDLSVSGEGESVPADDNCDDDVTTSDGGCRKQTRRGSSNKRKLRKNSVNIGTWNVQTLRDTGKFLLLLEELKSLNMNITGLCEIRWSGEGKYTSGDHTIVYKGNNIGAFGVAIVLDKKYGGAISSFNTISDRIVTVKLKTKPVNLNIIQVYAPQSGRPDEEVESFYNDLQSARDKIPKREICIVMGDLNAKVGEGEDPECGIGPYGHDRRNARGNMLATFCQANQMTIANTLFPQPNRRRYTWISPLDGSRHQNDYIIVDNAWKSTIMSSKAKPGADCDSDHNLVIAKLRMKAYTEKKTKPTTRYDVEKLKDSEFHRAFQIETENRFSALLDEWSTEEKMPNELWEDMKAVWTECAEAKLGKKTRKASKPYISEEVMELARKKSQARKNNKKEEYQELKREIKSKVRRDKEAWLEAECAKITQSNVQRKSKEMFQQIAKISYKKFQATNQCVNNKKGETLTETEDILARWHEYGKTLFEKTLPDPKDSSIPSTYEPEPEPLLSEVRAAIKQLKNGKSPGLDNIPGEILKSTGESGIVALHLLCCKIWTTCQWPTDWKLQEFVMLHKSGSIKDCGNYRTIALISHASKILLIILLNRMKPKVEAELSDCQAGYRSNRGTTDMLFTLQILIEKVRNTDQEAFITFIDYSKAFDSVSHIHLFHTMMKLGFPHHIVSLLAALYNDQKATIRWCNQNCNPFDIERGVRQGCILSPHLFSIYTEQVMREADIEDMGIKIGGRNITDLRYADDTALISDNITSMKRLLYRVDSAGVKAGLKLNAKKTKVMHIEGIEKGQKHEIHINGTLLEQVEDFKYLGSIKAEDSTCSKDIRARIGMAKQKMVQLNNVWKDRGMPNSLKLKLLKCLIWPVVLYGCEAWTCRKADEKKLEAAEMWFYRRLLRVSWKEKRTNNSILEQLSVEREILEEVNKRRLRYVGHAMRNTNTDLMATVFQGKVEAKRKKGRPSITYMENLSKARELNMQKVAHSSKNRTKWRRLVSASSSSAATTDDGDADR